MIFSKLSNFYIAIILLCIFLLGMIAAASIRSYGYLQGIEDGRQKLANETSERFLKEVFDGNYLLIRSMCLGQGYYQEPQQPEPKIDNNKFWIDNNYQYRQEINIEPTPSGATR